MSKYMDLTKLAKEVMGSDDFKDLLKGKLADKIVGSYHSNAWNEGNLIREPIRKLVRMEAVKIIKELTDDYEELTLKSDIEKIIRDFTKAEVIELLKDKFGS